MLASLSPSGRMRHQLFCQKFFFLVFLLFVQACQTTRVSQKSFEKSNEVTKLLKSNEEVKKTKSLFSFRKALNHTEKKLQEVLLDLVESESIRVDQEEEITILKNKLSTWTSIKVSFWILLSALFLFFGGKLIAKFRPSFF